MHETLASVIRGRRLVLVVAAPGEALAVRRAFTGGAAPADAPGPAPWTRTSLAPGVDLIATGIGKSNAAGACARLLDASFDGAVINVGVAGSLPDGPALLTAITASRSTFADEGVLAPDRFIDCETLGFPLGDFGGSSPPAHPGLVAACAASTNRTGAIATVSTCSGTDAGAAQVAARTGGVAEAMEGAAVLLAAHRLGIPAVEVRVISNTTGDRPRQRWDLAGALDRLTRVIGRIAGDARRP